jgi:stage II sporulation protein D
LRLCLVLLAALAQSCIPRQAVPVPGASAPEAPGEVVAAPALPAPAPDDPLALPPPPTDRGSGLFTKHLDFRAGDPWVPVKLMEGRREVVFSPRGRMRLHVPGVVEKTVEAPEGSVWRVRVRDGGPARLAFWVQLAEHRFEDREGLLSTQRAWTDRGVRTRVQILGALFGIAGKVIDNRRYLLLLDEPFGEQAAAQARLGQLLRHGDRLLVFEELAAPPQGALELLDEHGGVVAVGERFIEAETRDGKPFDVRGVEFGVGYDFHNFEDRTFRGALRLAVDRSGLLAVVNLVRLEDLLKGLVPAEIFASAHPQALKAQAVTARGEVLAKIGTRHLADPFLLCSEQHCAVYKGLSGEVPSTNAAVEETRGQALFDAGGRLVDSVYSAICGGHSEHNENVWGGVPNPSLRGRPDLLEPTGREPSPRELSRYLQAELPAACRLAGRFSNPARYRWERRFTQAEIDELTRELGVGRVRAITVTERGVSGRAKLLLISGDAGATQLRGELVIRRRFRNLNSAMFEVSAQKDGAGEITHWLFRGGGWGHGVGLCQTGAIGRAEAGHDYQQILRHYFNGAETAHIY